MNKKVSIVMPCYNADKFISKSIESVLAQTYTDWELLVVDDCSKDNSAAIVQTYAEKDSRVKYFRTPSPSGSAAIPRNFAIREATGRYLAFLDSDDLWMPDKLETQIPLFNDPNVGVVFSDYKKMNYEGKVSHRVVTAPRELTFIKALGGNEIGNLTAVYDTEKCGKVYQKRCGHEDYLMWLTILQMGFIAKNTRQLHAIYRQWNASLSGNKLNAARWHWNIYRSELKLPLFLSLYFFMHYILKGIVKFLK